MGWLRHEQWETLKHETKRPDAAVHGSLYVKDLAGNIHYWQPWNAANSAHASSDKINHVEDVLIAMAVKRWTKETKLQAVKVTIAPTEFPDGIHRCATRFAAAKASSFSFLLFGGSTLPEMKNAPGGARRSRKSFIRSS